MRKAFSLILGRSRPPRVQRRRGAVLITAMIFALMSMTLLGGFLILANRNYALAYQNSRSEEALELAEAGLNYELQYVATYPGLPPASTSSNNQSCNWLQGTAMSGCNYNSDPPVNTGQTGLTFPGDSHTLYGYFGTISGMPTGSFYCVYASNNSAGTAAWDGKTLPVWVVSTAYVPSGATGSSSTTGASDGVWKRVSVESYGESIFGLYAIMSLGAYSNNSKTVTLSNATVTVSGTAGTNGVISNSSSTLVASNLLDANGVASSGSSAGYSSGNLASGGTLYTQPLPVVYPTSQQVLERLHSGSVAYGTNPSTDMAGWNYIMSTTHNNNSTGIYTYGTQSIPISAVTEATPIEITTSSAVYLTSGQQVTITGVTYGNGKNNTSNADGTNYAQVVDSTHFYLYGAYSGGVFSLPVSSDGNKAPGISSAKVVGVPPDTDSYAKISSSNCVVMSGGIGVAGDMADDATGSDVNIWAGASSKPGSHGAVKTIIFEPGDYYFNNINISYYLNPYYEIVIDPYSLASVSGGTSTPQQIRFWVFGYTSSSGKANPKTCSIQEPVVVALGSGQSVPDPNQFRIYYGNDGGNVPFNFTRSASIPGAYPADAITGEYSGGWEGSGSTTGSFPVYGGVYAVTKPYGDTSSLSGTSIGFTGTSSSSSGITLVGSLLADSISFSGICNITYVQENSSQDLVGGLPICCGGYSDGG